MTTFAHGRKAGLSVQIDVQIDQVSTKPQGDLTAAPLPDLDFDTDEQTQPNWAELDGKVRGPMSHAIVCDGPEHPDLPVPFKLGPRSERDLATLDPRAWIS